LKKNFFVNSSVNRKIFPINLGEEEKQPVSIYTNSLPKNKKVEKQI